MSNKLTYIGYVTKTHGLDGTISIKLDLSNTICQLCDKIIDIYIDDQYFNINFSKLNSKIYLKMKLKEIDNKESAKLLLRKSVYINQTNYPKIKNAIDTENELINYEVFDLNRNFIGILSVIDFNRAQPIMIIKNQDKKIISPFVDQFIHEIDKKSQKIIVDLPNGLIEICTI